MGSNHRAYWRRLAVAIVALVVADRFVPSLVARVEADRYESARLFRFENSDLFSLGPLVAYLREQPIGQKPRVAFFGDSMIWGYFVRPSETLPAQFQRLQPGLRVFNLGINGFETGSSLLMAKAMIDSVDTLYVLYHGETANRQIARFVNVDEADVERFHLDPPDRTELAMERALAFWNLYTDTYRLQSGLFGTSTRLYVYLHKADLARRLLGRPVAGDAVPAVVEGAREAAQTIVFDSRRAPAAPLPERLRALALAHPIVWDLATLAKTHRRQVVVLEVTKHSPLVPADDRADMNAAFWPYATMIQMTIPDALKIDGLHLTSLGSAAVAETLSRHAPPMVSKPPS